MIARVRQGLMYLFVRYKAKWDSEVKKVLSEEEFEVFQSMSNYDRVHSYRLYGLVKNDKLLKDNLIYYKLALLHDCGKYNASLYRRVKKVLIGEKSLENHSEISYEKLKGINFELAKLAKNHHYLPQDKYMKRFQELDDR